MTFDTVIHGGTVVTAEGQFQGDVGIAEGRIAAVAERIRAARAASTRAGGWCCPAGSRPMPISHRKARRA